MINNIAASVICSSYRNAPAPKSMLLSKKSLFGIVLLLGSVAATSLSRWHQSPLPPAWCIERALETTCRLDRYNTSDKSSKWFFCFLSLFVRFENLSLMQTCIFMWSNVCCSLYSLVFTCSVVLVLETVVLVLVLIVWIGIVRPCSCVVCFWYVFWSTYIALDNSLGCDVYILLCSHVQWFLFSRLWFLFLFWLSEQEL